LEENRILHPDFTLGNVIPAPTWSIACAIRAIRPVLLKWPMTFAPTLMSSSWMLLEAQCGIPAGVHQGFPETGYIFSLIDEDLERVEIASSHPREKGHSKRVQERHQPAGCAPPFPLIEVVAPGNGHGRSRVPLEAGPEHGG
jgi:hypothetical protein